MKSVKKEMILVIGLLSLFATVSLVSLIKGYAREPEIEYRDRIVEVEKPVEVIKEVEVVKEVPVEVEKIVYVDRPVEVEKIVERSQVDLSGLDVIRVHNNLYEFEFTAYQFYNNSSPIEQVFELHGLDTTMDYSGSYIFRTGELISKPGYIIQDIVLTNPRQMATPYVLDNDGNNISPSNIIDPSGVVGSVFKYENLAKENIHISFGYARKGYELYGAESVRVTFSIRY